MFYGKDMKKRFVMVGGGLWAVFALVFSCSPPPDGQKVYLESGIPDAMSSMVLGVSRSAFRGVDYKVDSRIARTVFG